MKIQPMIVLLCLLGGCQERAEPPDRTASAPPAATEHERPLPRSYLDEPPPGPVSDTYILSGGTLVAATPENDLFDAVVVISQGVVIATGKRGAVAVPADSIGIDTSGKFIVADASNATAANLTIYNQRPADGVAAEVFAQVIAGEWLATSAAAND